MGSRGKRRSDHGRGRSKRRFGLSDRAADRCGGNHGTSRPRSSTTYRGTRMKRVLTVCAALSLSFASVARAQDIPAEYQQVLTALGKQGDYKSNVLKVNIPRNDVSVTVANVKTPTPFGFGGWLAMTKGTGRRDG